MMKVSVPSASALSDLAHLAEILKLLSDKKGMGDVLLEIKSKMDAAIAKEQEVSKRESECAAKMEELKKAEEGIAQDKALSEKYLENSKKLYSEAEATAAATQQEGSKLSSATQEFEEYKKSKLQDIASAESKIAADLAKAHSLLKDGQAMKAEYEEKLAKIKQAVG